MPNAYGSWRTGIQIDNIYPVGSIYMSVNSTNPGSLFGGTWVQITDTFLLCCGSTYAAGATGGTTTHSHNATTSGEPSNNTSGSTAITIAQMPSHNHGQATLKGTGSYYTAFIWDDGYHPGRSWTDGIVTVRQLADNNERTTPAWDSNRGRRPGTIEINASHTHTSQGSGSGHTHTLSSHTHSIPATNTINHLPPYLAVYVWKRTA